MATSVSADGNRRPRRASAANPPSARRPSTRRASAASSTVEPGPRNPPTRPAADPQEPGPVPTWNVTAHTRAPAHRPSRPTISAAAPPRGVRKHSRSGVARPGLSTAAPRGRPGASCPGLGGYHHQRALRHGPLRPLLSLGHPEPASSSRTHVHCLAPRRSMEPDRFVEVDGLPSEPEPWPKPGLRGYDAVHLAAADRLRHRPRRHSRRRRSSTPRRPRA